MSQSYIYNTNNISKKNNFSNSMNSKLIDTYDKSNIKIPELLIKYFKNKNLKYNLKQRIFYYNHIIERLKNISNNQCLVEYDINSKKSNNNKGYSINDTIFLTKKFGSISKYGYIYITAIRKEIGKFPIASKIMINNSVNLFEANTNLKITDKIVKTMCSRHFILTYKVIMCDKITNKNLPDIVVNKKYYVLLNELARGDLKQLCSNKLFLKNDNILYNVFIQIILSISTFHHLGYVHGDCHWGNFLYQINYGINKNSYHHYNIYGNSYYLKSCEYTMFIYDFGFAKKLISSNISTIEADYVRLINAFKNKNIEPKSWISVDNNLPSDSVGFFVKLFKNAIYENTLAKNNNAMFLENLTNNTIIPILLNAPNNIFVNKLPPKATIINKKPYYINKKILIKN
jgi:hypothetical protein